MAVMPTGLIITAEEQGWCGGHMVHLNGKVIGFRRYDGSDSDDVAAEVATELAGILREKLGWPEKDPDEGT